MRIRHRLIRPLACDVLAPQTALSYVYGNAEAAAAAAGGQEALRAHLLELLLVGAIDVCSGCKLLLTFVATRVGGCTGPGSSIAVVMVTPWSQDPGCALCTVNTRLPGASAVELVPVPDGGLRVDGCALLRRLPP